MPRTRKPYPPEFRQQIIELVRAGRTPEELAEEFEPSAESIRNWVKQAERDGGTRSDGLSSAEREELKRLRRENKQLRLEREILSKAAAWFARATNSIPPKSSSS
jgi:transposase